MTYKLYSGLPDTDQMHSLYLVDFDTYINTVKLEKLERELNQIDKCEGAELIPVRHYNGSPVFVNVPEGESMVLCLFEQRWG